MENSGTDCDCRSEVPPLYTPEETTFPYEATSRSRKFTSSNKSIQLGKLQRSLFARRNSILHSYHKQGPSRVPTTGGGQNSVCPLCTNMEGQSGICRNFFATVGRVNLTFFNFRVSRKFNDFSWNNHHPHLVWESRIT